MDTEGEVREAVVQAPFKGGYSIFLEGPAGAGKTTLAVQRLRYLLEQGVPGDTVLVLTPQRTLGLPYRRLITSLDLPGGSEITLATVGGLARRTIDLFWPLVAAEAGFDPLRRPVFLTLETAQYYMDRALREFLEKRYFDGIAIRRNRLASQILDNLNKAAVVGFPITEIAARLQGAWRGEPARLRAYDQVQECALAFRAYCLAHNLLDFSLQIEVFFQHLLPRPEGQDYLFGRYRHLVADNIEEDVPVAHDLLRQWLERCESALLIYDQDAGYRAFLGADPDSAYRLKPRCRRWMALERCLVASADLQALGRRLSPSLHHLNEPEGDLRKALHHESRRFHPQMLDWVADEVSKLVQSENVRANEIAVLAPYLSDALRFSLTQKLARYGIATVSHRPSRALKEEPGARCLLTLAALAHPDWGVVPSAFDVVQMLVQAIEGMDLARAQVLARIVYRPLDGQPRLTPFQEIVPGMQQRVTYLLGGRYDELRQWLGRYQQDGSMELDHFIAKLFSDLLSQPGFGFHRDLDAARVASELVESVAKFRQVTCFEQGLSVGREYLETIERGIVAAQYLGSWQLEEEDAVLVMPAYTFLMRNRPVSYQFWISVGSVGWWERPYQPLTHPYVLTRRWPKGRPWTDADEYEARQMAMEKLLLGLIRRCRKGIYLGISDLGESGFEQRGPLLDVFQRTLRQIAREEKVVRG